MTSFTRSDDLSGATFTATSLRGARFVGADLSGAVLRGVDVQALDVESPWLFDGESALLVNGVDVVPLVDAELTRRFPGRELRRAGDAEGLRAAYAALEASWAPVLERVAALPPGTADESVDGEWSFAQTLRHLVLATDLWLGQAVLSLEQPFHPLGLPYDGWEDDGHDWPGFSTGTPTFAEVLEARASRTALVRDFLSSVTPEQLAETRPNPHAPDHPETVLSCVQVILGEEWEHLRYAVRDLDTIQAREA